MDIPRVTGFGDEADPKTEATIQALISQVQGKASVAQAARTLDALR